MKFSDETKAVRQHAHRRDSLRYIRIVDKLARLFTSARNVPICVEYSRWSLVDL